MDLSADPSDTSGLEPCLGACIEEFGAAAEAMGWTVRVVEIDGESLFVTMDFNPSRVNVSAETGQGGTQTVTAILNVG